ncbi:CAP domain-containing protein [Chloroflexota bacterium]
MIVTGSSCFAPSTPSATASEVENGIFQLVNEERVDQGRSALSRSTSLDALARDYAASEFDEATADSTNLVYLVSNTWLLDFNGGSPSLTEGTAADQVDYCLGQSGMRDALLRQEAAETGVGVVTVGGIVYFAQVFDVIRNSGGDGDPIILDENPLASNPEWDDLVDFLLNDTTDDVEYQLSSFICGDYAEMLHNNAEDAGIRAAYVTVRLEEEPGHALNAFMVDGQTVFIDAGYMDDGVAYMEIGQDYGTIGVATVDASEDAGRFTYTFFTDYDGPDSGSLQGDNNTVADYYIHW